MIGHPFKTMHTGIQALIYNLAISNTYYSLSMAINQVKNHQETAIHPCILDETRSLDYLNIRQNLIKHYTTAEWDLRSLLTERSGLYVFINAHTCSICIAMMSLTSW